MRNRVGSSGRGTRLAAAIVGAAIVIAGCSSGNSGGTSPAASGGPSASATAGDKPYAGTEITIIAWDPANKMFGPLTDKFTKQTGITVKFITAPFADLGTKYAVALASQDSSVDVYFTWAALTAQYGPSLFVDVGSTLGNDFLKEYSPASLAAVQQGGVTYGLPYYNSIEFLYYNKTLFQKAGLDPSKPPQNWAEFVEYGKKLTVSGQTFGWHTELGSANSTFATVWAPQLNSAGGKMYSDDLKKVAFNAPAGVAAMQAIKDAFDAGVVDPSSLTATTSQDTATAFASGRVAMMFMFPLGYAIIADATKSKVNPNEVGFGLIPGVSLRSGTVNGAEGFAVSKFSKHQEAALEWIKYITGDEGERAMLADQKWVPARLAILQDSSLAAQLPTAQIVAEQGTYPADRYGAPWYSDAADVIDKWVHKVIANEASPKDAVNSAAAEMQAVMDKYWSSQPQ